MSRTYVVTGSASGIGAATTAALKEQGHRVVGVDIRDADVVADLSSPEGRRAMVERVGEITGGVLDGVVANAGLMAPTAPTVAVNYYGAVGTLEGLRPLLAASPAPRAVATVSGALLVGPDVELLDALLDGEEATALGIAHRIEAVPEGERIYATSKRALARWVRRAAPTPEWAGNGIALNAVAPGFVATPMVAEYLAAGGASARATSLMPLGGIADADELAAPIVWLVSEQNSQLCGQVIFVDGGIEVVARGDDIWATADVV